MKWDSCRRRLLAFLSGAVLLCALALFQPVSASAAGGPPPRRSVPSAAVTITAVRCLSSVCTVSMSGRASVRVRVPAGAAAPHKGSGLLRSDALLQAGIAYVVVSGAAA